MAIITKKPTSARIELGIVHHLKSSASLKGCAVVAKHDTAEAPESLPCIIVHCTDTARFDGVIEFYAKTATVTCTLYADTEQTPEATIERMAQEMEDWVDARAQLKARFNVPTSGTDDRKVKGVHLHEVLDSSAESSAEGTTFAYAVTLSLAVQEIDE